MRFANQVALVTGGTGGLGKAVSLALLAEGAKVTVTYIISEEFAALREAAGSKSDALQGEHIDVTDEADDQAAYNQPERALDPELVDSVAAFILAGDAR